VIILDIFDQCPGYILLVFWRYFIDVLEILMRGMEIFVEYLVII